MDQQKEKHKAVLLDELVEQIGKYLELRQSKGNIEEFKKCGLVLQQLFNELHESDKDDKETK